MNYTQLTRERRYQIYALKKAGQNQSQIALVLGCHKSTISRELRRNCGEKGYRPYQADELAYDRQCEAYRSRIGLGNLATGRAALTAGLGGGAHARQMTPLRPGTAKHPVHVLAWETWQLVERLLRQDWSPEQIAGRLKFEQ